MHEEILLFNATEKHKHFPITSYSMTHKLQTKCENFQQQLLCKIPNVAISHLTMAEIVSTLAALSGESNVTVVRT